MAESDSIYEKMLAEFDPENVSAPDGELRWPPVRLFQDDKSDEEIRRGEESLRGENVRADSEPLEVASKFFGKY